MEGADRAILDTFNPFRRLELVAHAIAKQDEGIALSAIASKALIQDASPNAAKGQEGGERFNTVVVLAHRLGISRRAGGHRLRRGGAAGQEEGGEEGGFHACFLDWLVASSTRYQFIKGRW